ncbi:MAG: hypothetical protein AAF528_06925 [Cyanobacteria bacterium P01_C01_bin.121]
MDLEQIDLWFPPEQQRPIIENICARVGSTRTRAEYFVRLWVYLMVKQLNSTAGQQNSTARQQSSTAGQQNQNEHQPPLKALTPLTQAISCSHREAAWLFYGDKDTGSDRAAGMMLDKLAALGLITKHFDGNTTRIQIHLDSTVLALSNTLPANPETEQNRSLIIDDFNPRCDAVPVANLLTVNYSWMNRSLEIVPHRITRLLRRWANEYATGMRVLRRTDNLNPVGFYLLYPTAAESEINFSSSPTKALHLASMNEVDPFTLATPGDPECTAIFVRSWMIDPNYLEAYRVPFLQDAQKVLRKMQKDFPNLCDLYTLIIHPSYEMMATKMAFQRIGTQTSRDTQLYWMYQALDRYLALDLEQTFE